jgi:hypothetical protein
MVELASFNVSSTTISSAATQSLDTFVIQVETTRAETVSPCHHEVNYASFGLRLSIAMLIRTDEHPIYPLQCNGVTTAPYVTTVTQVKMATKVLRAAKVTIATQNHRQIPNCYVSTPMSAGLYFWFIPDHGCFNTSPSPCLHFHP